ncbi:MAG TPA: type 4a pilus biogenesis protein PilO [Vicinamibacteria bacterium]|nr:type 4a pilus biogenesis protein PilO [Vicinamibacteria bacterium]
MGRMSLGAQVVVFAIIGVLLYGAFWYFFYSPMQVERDNKTATKRNLQAEVDNAKTTAARLPEFRREVERKEATLQALSRILPSQKEVDDLLRKVQQLAAESSLNVLRFKPEATKPQNFYAEWPISLELDGSYHNLAYFFDRLSRLSRIVNVSNLEVDAKQEPSIASTITAKCTATTFVFIEAPPPAPPVPGQKPGQKPGAAPPPGAPAAR